jgi:hypothetical protein
MRLVLSMILLAATLAWGAEDPWQKARELATGSDIRIYKSGSTKPVSGKMAGVGDGKVQVIVKNDQIAIKQSDIDRIDFRPPGSKSKTESNGTTTDGFGTSQSASSGTSWSREGWQTVYRKSR